MSGRSLLGWLLNAPPPPPPTRLTAKQAIAIAAADPAVVALRRPLPMATIVRNQEALVWRISSATIGAQWWVEVDDATGMVGEPRQTGLF